MVGFKRGRREARNFWSVPWALSLDRREAQGFDSSKLRGCESKDSAGRVRGLSHRGVIERLEVVGFGIWVFVGGRILSRRTRFLTLYFCDDGDRGFSNLDYELDAVI